MKKFIVRVIKIILILVAIDFIIKLIAGLIIILINNIQQ